MRQILLNAVISGATCALIGLGFGLVLATRRFFHVAHGAVVTAAAYFCWAALHHGGLAPLWAAGIATLAAGGLGMLLDAAVYRPLRRRRAGPTALLISSLGLLVALQNLLSLAFGDDVLTLRQGGVEAGFEVWGARMTRVQALILAVALVTWLLAWLLLRSTRLGWSLRAVADDPELAHLQGLPVERLSLLVFFAGSALGGIAGILHAFDVGLTPTLGFQALFLGVAAVLVGGLGNLAGLVPAALLVGLTREAAGWWLPTQWQDTSVFVLLILFLVLRPRGILGGAAGREA